jgi:hypothetical protein
VVQRCIPHTDYSGPGFALGADAAVKSAADAGVIHHDRTLEVHPDFPKPDFLASPAFRICSIGCDCVFHYFL